MIRPPRSAVILMVALAKFVESKVATMQLTTKRTCRMNFPPRGRCRQFYSKPEEFMAAPAFFATSVEKSKFHSREPGEGVKTYALIPRTRGSQDEPRCHQNEDRQADPVRAAAARRDRPSERGRRPAWRARRRVKSRPCSRP